MTAFRPLRVDNWNDFVELMGNDGRGCGGCWCTWWRMSRSQWNGFSREQRHDFLKSAVDASEPVGVLLYQSQRPVGWCAVAPRASYPTMAKSTVMYPIDELESWCISCLFVRPGSRRQGLMEVLIRAGTRYALANGAPAVDGFPQKSRRVGFVERFVGVEGSFVRAGFSVVGSRGPNRVAVRLRPGSDCLDGTESLS
jgi:GNAT superfamily N-acetyltransferase